MADKPTDDRVFGPAWEGWETYRLFAESVKDRLRYVRHTAAEKFLDEIRASCHAHKETMPRGFTCWRARLGCEVIERKEDAGDFAVSWPEAQPYAAQQMKPISVWHSEGRANPRGIPYLYLATTRETALAEVRPWIGSTISVGEFHTTRDFNVIDCSKHHSKEHILKLLDKCRTREEGIWIAIDQAFATPVTKDEEARDYIPTQIIAELFKHEGYDGVVYKSLLSEDGFNLALFDIDAATMVRCDLYTATSLKFDFKSEDKGYFSGI